MMVAADIYKPEQWREFYLMVGSGAAALTGLVFVALSLNLESITQDLTHRQRAIGALTGLTAVFMRCGLVLMGGQNHTAVGLELLIVAGIAGGVFLGGYFRAENSNQNVSPPSLYRTIGGSVCYLIEMIGAVVLILGSIVGLYIASIAMIVNFYFMISGAWLLVVGVFDEKLQNSKH
jgi:hypothetical protein